MILVKLEEVCLTSATMARSKKVYAKRGGVKSRLKRKNGSKSSEDNNLITLPFPLAGRLPHVVEQYILGFLDVKTVLSLDTALLTHQGGLRDHFLSLLVKFHANCFDLYEYKNVSAVKWLLSRKLHVFMYNVELRDETKCNGNPLHRLCASEREQPDIFEYLLTHSRFSFKFDQLCINERVSIYSTPLFGSQTALNIACSKGYADLVRLLISIGRADVDTICSWRTALMTACEVGHFECVKVLVEVGNADINKSNTMNTGMTAMIIAARDGHFEILKYLIEKGGNVFLTDSDGRNCLAHAVEHKHYDIFEYLAALMLPKPVPMRPITPKKSDSPSMTEMNEILDEDTSTTSLLHSSMAQAAYTPVNFATSEDDTPAVPPIGSHTLSQISSLSSNTHVDDDSMKEATEPEITVNDTYSISGDRYTLLHIATRKKDTKIFTKLLQDYDADLNAKSGSLQSTLFLAARDGSTEILNLLLSDEYRHLLEEDGIDAIDARLQTPLIAAATNQHYDACKILVENGCDVNKVDENSRTALMSAARVGNVDIVRLLVNKQQREESRRAYEKKYLKIDSVSAEQLADIRNASSKKKKSKKNKKKKGSDTDDKPGIRIDLSSESSSSAAAETVPTPCSQNDKVKDICNSNCNAMDIVEAVDDKENCLEINKTVPEAESSEVLKVEVEEKETEAFSVEEQGEMKAMALADSFSSEMRESVIRKREMEAMDLADSFSSKLRQSVNRKTYTPFFLKQKNIADITIRSNEGKDALLYAALGNHMDVIKVLVEEGDADVNGFDTIERLSPLIVGVNVWNKEMVEYLTERGADLNHQDHEKCTALLSAIHRATMDNQGGEYATKRATIAFEIAKYLIDKGAGVDIVDNQGNTCLISAADNGHEELCLKLLNETDTNPHAKDMYNCTPLLSSCKKGLKNVVPLLLARNVELDHQDDHGWTALMYATTKENIDIVNMLLAANANADCEPKEGPYQGLTALIRAAYKGYKDICRVLIEKGNANVNHQNKEGSSALSYASEGGRYEVVDLLLEHNTDVETMYFEDGKTPLLFAACNATNSARDVDKGIDHIKVIRSLIAKGANIEKTDKGGQTALIHASMEGFTEAAQCLCEANAQINIFDSYKQSPLMSACRRNKVETATVLVDVGRADIDLLSPYNASPLTLAAERGHLNAVEFLLERGIKLSTVNARHTPCSKEGEKLVDGRTALMLAISNTAPFTENRKEICLKLVNYYCDLNVQDDSGHTALMHLAKRGTAIRTSYSKEIAEAMIKRKSKILPKRHRSKENQIMNVKEKVYSYNNMLRDENGCTALYHFSEVLNKTAVKLILDKNKNVISINSNTNMSPLMIAAKKTVHSGDNELSPALECIMHLLEAGCDVYHKHNDTRMTALHYACEVGSDNVAMFVLAHQFLSKCKDSNIMFPKIYDAWDGAASSPNDFDSPRKGALRGSGAPKKKKRKVLNYLLGHGNVAESSSSTEAVNRAEAEEQEDNEAANASSSTSNMARRTRSSKKEESIPTPKEETESIEEELVFAEDQWEHLLLTDISFPLLDMQDSQGRTALMLAMQTRNVKLVELLVKLGASRDIMDNTGRLASQYLDHAHTDTNATATLNRIFFQETSPGIMMLKEKAVNAHTRLLQSPTASNNTQPMVVEENMTSSKGPNKRARSESDVSDCSEVILTGSAIGAAVCADINEAFDSDASNQGKLSAQDILSMSSAGASQTEEDGSNKGNANRKRVNWDSAERDSTQTAGQDEEDKQGSSLLQNNSFSLVIEDKDSRLRALLLVALGFDPNDTSKYNSQSNEDTHVSPWEPFLDINFELPIVDMIDIM